MNIILFDDPSIRIDLLPFTYTRPVSKIRTGILTIDEKWAKYLNAAPSFLTESYLQEKYPLSSSSDNLLINGAICPDEHLVQAVLKLKSGELLIQHDTVLAAHQSSAEIPDATSGTIISYKEPITIIDKVWKIFELNAVQIKADFKYITKGRTSFGIQDEHTIVYGAENLFVEEGVKVRAAVINADRGPVYLGKNAVINEGAVVRGSFALCEGAEVNVGAKIRGDSTIGPYSKVGGEMAAAVIFGFSNKSHDGYLGCSVIGEWCNLGADSNTSNLKNSYDTVKLWSHRESTFIDTGLQFLGLMMGDHSKCAINTMFNTGTVVDVSSNVFGEGFIRNYIPSFAWGGSHGMTTYKLDKAVETAERVLERRNMTLDEMDKAILQKVFEITGLSRNWEQK